MLILFHSTSGCPQLHHWQLLSLNTALAYGLYVWLLRRMTVVEFTFAGVTNPIAGILSGLVLMGESFSIQQYSLMGAIILTSLISPLVGNYQKRKEQKNTEAPIPLLAD